MSKYEELVEKAEGELERADGMSIPIANCIISSATAYAILALAEAIKEKKQ